MTKPLSLTANVIPLSIPLPHQISFTLVCPFLHFLSQESPIIFPDLEKSVEAGEINVVPNIYSPINPEEKLLNSTRVATGATTSNLKAENLNQKTHRTDGQL